MSDFNSVEYKKMVKEFQESDNPLGWFDSIYTDAQGDYKAVFCADLEPSPYLLEWIEKYENKGSWKKSYSYRVRCG